MSGEREDIRGVPPKMGLSSGGEVPCSIGFPCWVSVLGTYLYQCTSWWCCERLHSASVNLSWRLWAFAHFMMCYLRAHLPTQHWVFSSFWPKMAWPLYPIPPYWPHLTPKWLFFVVSVDENIPQRKMFCQCGRDETENGRSTKGIKTFEQWKKRLDRCITSNREYFEGDWSLNI